MKRQVIVTAVLLAFMPALPALGQEPVSNRLPLTTVDAQFLDATEYLIAPDQLRWTGDYLGVGRLLALPTTNSGGRSQFLVVGRGGGWEVGDRAWANQYYQTRPARLEDITVGKRVFCFNEIEDGVYRAPRNRLEALASGWFATTITNVASIHANEVKAGQSRLSISCLRVLV